MELPFPHHVKYLDGATSIEELIANLHAQKRLIEEGVRFLDAAIAGLHVESLKIKVLSVTSTNPTTTDFLILVYTAYQKTIEDGVVGGIEGMFGVDIPTEWEPLVTLAALAATYFVARYAYDAIRDRKKKPDAPASTHIQGDYNTVVNVLASKLQLPFAEVEGALMQTLPVGKRRGLLKSVSRFFRPRLDGKISAIEVEGFGEISQETIRELPSEAELTEIDDTRNVDLPSVRLNIRATDKDRRKSGWGAVVVGDRRFRKRLPMDLYPTVDAEELSKRDTVVGDIIIEGDRTAEGKFKPKRIHLLAVKPDDATD